MSKCFECREPKPEGKVFCKKCEAARNRGDLQVKSGEVLVIYDKI